MKKTIISLIIVLILLSSCAERIQGPQDRLAELKAEYNECGIQHNNELSQVYREFVDSDLPLNKEVLKSIVDKHFASSTSIVNGNIALDISSLIMDSRSLYKSNVHSDIMTVLADSLDIYAQYPAVFDSIASILDAQITIKEKTEKLENIYLFIDEVCSNPDDKNALMNGVSTSLHSLNFWDENLNEWQQLINSGMPKPSIGIAGALAIIDGTGAVIGTLEGIRDTQKGQEGRGKIIVGRAIGEAAKTSSYVVLAMVLI